MDFWPFPLHAATIFNLPNFISTIMRVFVFFYFPIQFTFQAVQQMPVILVIQIAGESLFSVSSVFQELFSIKWSPNKRNARLMFSYNVLNFHHENGATPILTKTKWNSSQLTPWLTDFLLILIWNALSANSAPPTSTHAHYHHQSNLAQNPSYYWFKE